MGSWTFFTKRTIKQGWMGFIICKSNVTPTFFIHCTFRWCIGFYPLDIIYTTCVPNGLVRNYSDISQWTCNLNQSSVRRLDSVFDIFVFSIRVFFRKKRRLTGQQEKRGGHLYSTLPLPPTHEYSDIYFATLHVILLSHISNRTAWIYQAATRWDLPPDRITIWLIDDMLLILFVYLLIWFKVFGTAIWDWKPVDSNILWYWP